MMQGSPMGLCSGFKLLRPLELAATVAIAEDDVLTSFWTDRSLTILAVTVCDLLIVIGVGLTDTVCLSIGESEFPKLDNHGHRHGGTGG